MRADTKLAISAAVLLSSAAGAADDNPFRAAAGGGVTVPILGAATRRGPGPAVLVGLSHRVGLKAELSWELLDGPQITDERDRNYTNLGDLSVLGVSLGLNAQAATAGFAPYLGCAIGAYWMQRIGGTRSPYGITWGVHATAGIDWKLEGPIHPFVELRGIFHLTDYGSQEWNPTIYFPVVAGARFQF